MRLKVVTPTRTAFDGEVCKIVAEAVNGAFGLLENHIDFVTQLRPGVLVYDGAAGEGFLGLDSGTLVKRGSEVTISTHSAIAGDDLGMLKGRVQAEFLEVDEQERRARTALARLEAGMIRQFILLEQVGEADGL